MWQIQMSYIDFKGFLISFSKFGHCFLTTPILPMAFSRGLLIYKIKNRFNKFGLSFSRAAFFATCHYKG